MKKKYKQYTFRLEEDYAKDLDDFLSSFEFKQEGLKTLADFISKADRIDGLSEKDLPAMRVILIITRALQFLKELYKPTPENYELYACIKVMHHIFLAIEQTIIESEAYKILPDDELNLMNALECFIARVYKMKNNSCDYSKLAKKVLELFPESKK